MICEAKFSNFDTTRKYRYPDVIKKYYYDIEENNSSNPIPICLLYGEYCENDPVITEFGEKIIDKENSEKYNLMSMILPLAPNMQKADDSIRKIFDTLNI